MRLMWRGLLKYMHCLYALFTLKHMKSLNHLSDKRLLVLLLFENIGKVSFA